MSDIQNSGANDWDKEFILVRTPLRKSVKDNKYIGVFEDFTELRAKMEKLLESEELEFLGFKQWELKVDEANLYNKDLTRYDLMFRKEGQDVKDFLDISYDNFVIIENDGTAHRISADGDSTTVLGGSVKTHMYLCEVYEVEDFKKKYQKDILKSLSAKDIVSLFEVHETLGLMVQCARRINESQDFWRKECQE